MKTSIKQTSSEPSALAIMANRLGVDRDNLYRTLMATVFKGATQEEAIALTIVANSHGLNPLTREIFAFPKKGGGITPVVSIDGWIRLINEHPQCDGFEFEDILDDGGNLVGMFCRIYRKDRRLPIVVPEYLDECRRNTEPWNTMPRRMLRHKALKECARYAFGFAGVYDEDEAEQAPSLREITPTMRPTKGTVVVDPFAGGKETTAEPEDGMEEQTMRAWIRRENGGSPEPESLI